MPQTFVYHLKAIIGWILLNRVCCLQMSLGDSSKPSIGLALAGGGNRASSACIGVLRGLQQKTLTNADGTTCPAMDCVSYLSGISGGSLPAAQYSFAQTPTNDLLETSRSVDPAKITQDLLDELPRNSMGYSITTSPVARVRLPKILFVMRKLPRLHSWWPGIVFRNYFKSMDVPKNKLFASSEEEVESILKNNPKLRKDDFIVPRPDTKPKPLLLFSLCGSYLDFGSFMKKASATHEKAWELYHENGRLGVVSMTDCLLQAIEDAEDDEGVTPVPFTVTPDAVSTHYHGTATLKGGIAQMEKVKVTFPLEDTKPYAWGLKTRYSIESATAMSTNFLGLAIGFLSQVLKVNVGKDKTSRLAFADGGLNDVCGILPLLQRKIRNILCVFNFNQNPPHANFQTTYADIYNAAPSTDQSDPNFDKHFRTWLNMMDPRITCYFGYFGKEMIEPTLADHVFADPKLDRLKELMTKYNSLFEAGEPLIVTLKDLEVLDNPFWGTEAGEKVNLTFLYFNMPKEFSSKVPIEAVPPPQEGGDKIDSYGQFTNEIMKAVPELPWEPPKKGMTYSNAQVNMMSYLGSWIVHHAWGPLQGHDGDVKFEGIGELFDGSVDGISSQNVVMENVSELR